MNDNTDTSPNKTSPNNTPTGRTTTIDCDTCVMQDTPACGDCVVTYLCERETSTAVVIDITDLRAMRMLADAGLVPELRHRSS